MPRNTHSPWTLLALLGLFLIPLIAAWWFYTSHQRNPNFRTTQFGQFIKPPIAMITLMPKSTRQQLKGKWTIALLNPTACQAQCVHALYEMRQIRRASGRHQRAIQPLLLTYRDAKQPLLKKLLTRYYPNIQLVVLNRDIFTNNIKQQFTADYALSSGTIYLIDPQGYAMMAYPPKSNASGIFKDLQRLLKVSPRG